MNDINNYASIILSGIKFLYYIYRVGKMLKLCGWSDLEHGKGGTCTKLPKHLQFPTSFWFAWLLVHRHFNPGPGTVADLVERGPHVWEIRSSVSGCSHVKPVTYQIYTCCFLTWHLALID